MSTEMSPKLSDSTLNKAQKVALKLGLDGVSKNSFLKLCDKGCDPEILANYLIFLTSNPEITISPNRKTKGGKDRESYQVSLRPMDSIDSALGGIKKQDLEPLKINLLEIAEEIAKINGTRIVRYISDKELNQDIFELPQLLNYYANHIIPLIVSNAEKVGARQKPDFNTYLNTIITHVEDTTGDPHYSLVCDVLNAVGLDYNEGSLKQKIWRIRGRVSTE